MASLNKLAIRGIRSFDDKQIAVIEFFSPVTVIVGHNGSGKTTIIECLKYATTGDQPPNTRGGAFVHDPKMANEKEVKAQVKLRFYAADKNRMLVVRNLSVSAKKTTGLTMKTLESILSFVDGPVDKTGKRATISSKCAEIDVEIPQLLGVSKSVLENVIFCHQEESYWPLAEPALLKKKFDDIFEATRYTKAVDAMKAQRKDRVAELKAEKERLESLSREKQHADKLRGRITDLTNDITQKEIKHEDMKKEYDALVMANKRFYDSATKFREMFLRLETLQKKEKELEDEIRLMRGTVREVPDTDEQLKERLANFDRDTNRAEAKLRTEKETLSGLDEELEEARGSHVSLKQTYGELVGEEKQHERNIADRDSEIRRLAQMFQIAGYNHVPLGKEEINAFGARLTDLQRNRARNLENIQSEVQQALDEFNRKRRVLETELEGFKQRRQALRSQLQSLTKSTSSLETELDALSSVSGDLQSLKTDLEDKRNRIAKTKNEIKTANCDEKIQEIGQKIRSLDDRRSNLNIEFRSLSLQADSRAKLELLRNELKSKNQEISSLMDHNNARYRKLVGKDIKGASIDKELDRAFSEKERELSEAEVELGTATKSLQQVETNLTSLKSQLKKARDEVKSLDKSLKEGLEGHASVLEAIQEANQELDMRKELSGTMAGTSQIYEVLLKTGKASKKCTACNRPLADHELPHFVRYLEDQMQKTSPTKIAENKKETEEWEQELKHLQSLLPIEKSCEKLRTQDIPNLESQIKIQETELTDLSGAVESAQSIVDGLKKDVKDMNIMKQTVSSITKLQSDVNRVKEDIAKLEDELSNTGSTKTVDDVQRDIDTLTDEIRTEERQKQTLQTDRDRQNTSVRTLENELHAMQLRESNLESQLNSKKGLEQRITHTKEEASKIQAQLKELDEKIVSASAPIDTIIREQEQYQLGSKSRISEAQEQCQELSRSADGLEKANKIVNMYILNKRDRHLRDCAEKIRLKEEEIATFQESREKQVAAISVLEKEIGAGQAALANLRDNVRLRKFQKSLLETREEINSYDIEEAGRARRQFDEKYGVQKEKESELQGHYSHLGGELASLKIQLKQLEKDHADFKDINKRYTDQLVKVKVSDMANNDLEKFAKALDNAIMKYHSLKMEEVNDVMRHLWNRTYQGTDIDGIKIRSDVEGGASKRSYNYRVVMTKDQVEMDMRGRCSAGQKMLASIIIRLALSDSFGQNCGILALDEPTNALDTENIDALAASLIDIIKERRNHANFQLIIITHDENFLRKLGQSDVMEYYWRVSRDARQKSIIERQRFA